MPGLPFIGPEARVEPGSAQVGVGPDPCRGTLETQDFPCRAPEGLVKKEAGQDALERPLQPNNEETAPSSRPPLLPAQLPGAPLCLENSFLRP